MNSTFWAVFSGALHGRSRWPSVEQRAPSCPCVWLCYPKYGCIPLERNKRTQWFTVQEMASGLSSTTKCRLVTEPEGTLQVSSYPECKMRGILSEALRMRQLTDLNQTSPSFQVYYCSTKTPQVSLVRPLIHYSKIVGNMLQRGGLECATTLEIKAFWAYSYIFIYNMHVGNTIIVDILMHV